jgi:prepilin-type processing-associated H-X9-DG protein
MNFDKMTWVGFMIVALGWTLLLSAPQLTDFLASLSGRTGGPAAFDAVAIAECTILSGFGIAILGALQTGFGATKCFMDAAMTRAVPPPTKVVGSAGVRPKKIAERGWVKDRAYVLFVDGSVEVETMLGRRLFASLQEAREFIA